MKTYKVLYLSVMLLLTSCTSNNYIHTEYIQKNAVIAENSSLALTYAGPETVQYFGLVNYDGLKKDSAPVMYYAPNAGVLLASIFTHAIVADSSKNSEKNKIQEQANQVLNPYRSFLNKIDYSQLMHGGVEELKATNLAIEIEAMAGPTSVVPDGQWVLESSPAFYMIQDQSGLIIKNSVAVYKKTEKPEIKYQNVIEVISTPYQGDDIENYWNQNSGEQLYQTSIDLFSASLELALADAMNTLQGERKEHQTFHFFQEGNKAFERGNLVEEQLDRLTIRTLRGWLKSVPIIASQEQIMILADNNSAIRGIGVVFEN